MEIHIQNRKKGFTLAELLVVVAIVAILAAISIPIFTRRLEASREATDLANVRSAYAEVMAAVMIEDTENEVKVVKLKQKKAKWQSHDPVTIGGVMHYNDQGDTANWIVYPVPGGECEISYQPNSGVLFNWKGGNGTGGSEQKYTFNINCDMHAPLNNSGVLEMLGNNNNFEIDSNCTKSNMLPKIQAKIEEDSLLKKGTWAYLGDAKDKSKRYLFWTSVDISSDSVGAGKKIPVIISTADGRFYISETTTAIRKNTAGNYVAIADHLTPKQYTEYLSNDKKYENLQEAYDAYAKLVTDGTYQQYKDTLPK